MLAGVAGGMAEYLDIDPTVSRILWILVTIFSGGLALIAYVILALVIPPAPIWANPGAAGPYAASAAGAGTWGAAPGYGAGAPGTPPAPGGVPQWDPEWAARAAAEDEARRQARGRGLGIGVIVGTILIVFGAFALIDVVLPAWSGAALFGPALLIALGAAFLVGSIRTRPEPAPAATPVAPSAPATPAPAAEPAQPATTDAVPAPYEATDTESLGNLASRD
jgi:phage shock protein PspC (stress-responsive transcriptional regulator)